MLYNNHLTVSEQIGALLGFVADGGGLVVLHCASASFQNSEAFIRLVGAAFKSHGTGTFSGVRVGAGHPALQGVPSFESWDETYIHTKHNPVNRTVLEVRRENGHDEPWTWVRNHGKGRVFYTAWGHDQRTWGNPGFQRLVEQGLRWAAGPGAPAGRAADAGPPIMDLAAPLPTYKRPPAPWNTLDTAITKAQAALPTRQSLALMTPAAAPICDAVSRWSRWWATSSISPGTRGEDGAVETKRLSEYRAARQRPGARPDPDPGMTATATAGRPHIGLPTGSTWRHSIAFANGGVIVCQAPHMLFFRDTMETTRRTRGRSCSPGSPGRHPRHNQQSAHGFDNQVWARWVTTDSGARWAE